MPPNSSTHALTCDVPLSISMETETIVKAIASFPCGSGAGMYGLLPQHLKDLTGPSAGDGGGGGGGEGSFVCLSKLCKSHP